MAPGKEKTAVFLESINFVVTTVEIRHEKAMRGLLDDIYGFPKVEASLVERKEEIVSLSSLGKQFYVEKFLRNDNEKALQTLTSGLRLHPAVLLICQVLAGHSDIQRVNVYNLLKHYDFSMSFDKEVQLNDFLEILRIGRIISYNKNTRKVRVLWKAEDQELPSYEFVSPSTPYSNLRRLKEIIRSFKGHVYWIDKHFDKKAFEIISDTLDSARVNHLTVISSNANRTSSAVSEFERLKTELEAKTIQIEWRVITDQSVLSGLHDRWLCDSDKSWNIPR